MLLSVNCTSIYATVEGESDPYGQIQNLIKTQPKEEKKQDIFYFTKIVILLTIILVIGGILGLIWMGYGQYR